MERKCKRCIYACDVDHGWLCCELDYESVDPDNSCDFFTEDTCTKEKLPKKRKGY